MGDAGFAALPDEVFALTGLKIKRRSPLPATFTVELANGSEGYIPPPEQHKLGGYTTWPARTAGLETGAEPKLVETVLDLLEEVSGRRRREDIETAGPYARKILASRPEAYWRLEEMSGPVAKDSAGRHPAFCEDGVAFYLPGADGREGQQPPKPAAPNAFSGEAINRAMHFAGGRLRAEVRLGRAYSAEFWFWNGLPNNARGVTAWLFGRGRGEGKEVAGEWIGIGGTNTANGAGRLTVGDGGPGGVVWVGKTAIRPKTWHHVAFARAGNRFQLYLDGRKEMDGELKGRGPGRDPTVFLGGRSDGTAGLEGKLDEVAVYKRALTREEVEDHYAAAQLRERNEP